MKAIARGSSGDPAVREDLQRQAESGDMAAQFALATALLGQKPPRPEEGMRWLLAAAKQGDDQIQFSYAKNLLVFRGAKAGKEATQWFTRSAQQGNDEAQYCLGMILYEGKLVPEDRVAAAQWILLAAAAKNSDARYLLKELQLFLTAGELAEARKRADAFKPVKQPAATPQK
jgi:TPR repeat protein